MVAWTKNIRLVAWCVIGVLAQASCSTIDDDLSDCGNDYEINYELRLVTNMTTELQTQLNTQTDVVVANALRQHLEDVFSDYAHDVDLSFYDVGADDSRLYHESPTMNANQRSYTIYLPVQRYMHLAAANLKNNEVVELAEDEHSHTSVLVQDEAASDNILPSHTTGLFTARQPMEVLSGIDQTFNVKLYMANCAAALVIDPQGHDVQNVKVYSTGFATGFNIEDSTYTFKEHSPLITADPVTTAADGVFSFCSVNFPSKESEANGSRVVIETTDPFIAADAADKLWEFRVFVTNADGSVTESTLGIRKPLRAGQLMIIKAYIDDDGAVHTDDHSVGVSVILNWNTGGGYDIIT